MGSKRLKISLASAARSLDLAISRPPALRKFPLLLPKSGINGECLDIKGFLQLDGHSCGAIAGWTIIDAIHPGKFDFSSYYTSFGESIINGLDDGQVLKSFRNFKVGYRKIPGTCTFEKIKNAISRGFPILSVISMPGRDADHWIVIYGYDVDPKNGEEIYLAGSNGLLGKMFGLSNPLDFKRGHKRLQVYEQYVCWGL